MSGLAHDIRRAGRLLCLFLLLSWPLAGCSSLSREQARQLGEVVGLVAGVAAGVAIGSEVGGDVAIAVGGMVGAALGAFIGGEIAQHLDAADRALAAQASQTALDYEPESPSAPRPSVAWASERDGSVHGSSTVLSSERGDGGGTCRLVHEVAYVAGEELRQEVTYCRPAAGGGWVRQA
ncbi:MAG TPA: hypothetical protein PKA13_15735 [Geminicoccaceae bacterium]|nr:hypothetical protein [Geminicoccus sp.]HMU51225.1 hypothetical protein [Geminicoccaceae bacterium]